MSHIISLLTRAGERVDKLVASGAKRCDAHRAPDVEVLVWMLGYCWEPTRCLREAGHRGQHENAFGGRWRTKVKEGARG